MEKPQRKNNNSTTCHLPFGLLWDRPGFQDKTLHSPVSTVLWTFYRTAQILSICSVRSRSLKQNTFEMLLVPYTKPGLKTNFKTSMNAVTMIVICNPASFKWMLTYSENLWTPSASQIPNSVVQSGDSQKMQSWYLTFYVPYQEFCPLPFPLFHSSMSLILFLLLWRVKFCSTRLLPGTSSFLFL